MLVLIASYIGMFRHCLHRNGDGNN